MRSMWKKPIFKLFNSSKKIIKIFNKNVVVDSSSVDRLFYIHTGKVLQHVILKNFVILRRCSLNLLSFYKKKDVLHKFKSTKNKKKSSKSKSLKKVFFKFL